MVASGLQLRWRPFALALPRPLQTARATLTHKRGWLLQLRSASGGLGWGEAAPLVPEPALEQAIKALGPEPARNAVEADLAAGRLPGPVAFALGAALAEADGLLESGWLAPPPSAQLLPAGPDALAALEEALQLADQLADQSAVQSAPLPVGPPGVTGPSFKWKVAVRSDSEERALLEQLLARLPAGARLRLDANGRWDRATATVWADRLAVESRLQWLEQPLDPADQAGLEALAARLPVALDESLSASPPLRQSWPGWQVRRPSQDGDPRPLMTELIARRPRLMLSTAFETGIGLRWLNHLAALQALGPTPAAPGLAPGWQLGGGWASANPWQVWEAAA
jgi:O-succinylbenzoate synthase